MTPILTTALVTHVIVGVTSIAFLHVSAMHLIRKAPNFSYIRKMVTGGFLTSLISWASAAYYYVVYYGVEVKPVILDSSYPWAHTIMMESKEHIFLILPFLALALLFIVRVLEAVPDDRLKRSAAVLAFVSVALGAYVALAGVLVSGAVR